MLKKEKQVKLVPADKNNQEEMEICAKCYCDAAGDLEAYDATKLRNSLEEFGDTYYLAKEGDKVVGGVLVSYGLTDGGSIWANGLAVLSAFRRQGYGKALMLALMAMLPKDYTNLWFGVRPENEVAKAFYSSLGFSRIQKTNTVEVWGKEFKVR